MAVRQYIGARYVPIFMGEHDITKSYEPLSIVTDAGATSSYTSKKFVPIGTPLSDANYWALTGTMSGAILNLQNRMNDAELNINNILVNKKENKRSFLCIGDSFSKGIMGSGLAESGGGWIGRFKTLMDNYDINVYDLGVGGSGFKNNEYLNAFNSWVSSVTTEILNSITDVVIIGGHNDRNIATLDTNVINTVERIKTVLPQAEIKIAPMSCHPNEMYGLIYEHYAKAIECGALVSKKLINAFALNSFIDSDNIHPTQAAYDEVCKYIIEFILFGDCSYEYVRKQTYKNSTFESVTLDVTVNQDSILIAPCNGNEVAGAVGRGGAMIEIHGNTYGVTMANTDNDYINIAKTSRFGIGAIVGYRANNSDPALQTFAPVTTGGLYPDTNNSFRIWVNDSVPIKSGYKVFALITAPVTYEL